MKKTSSEQGHRPYGALGRPWVLAAMTVAAFLPAAEHRAFAQARSASDIAQARELFNDGIRLRDQGDLPDAIEKLRAAHALGDTPITGLELGRAYLAAGKLVDAREVFLSVARIATRPAETARSTAARTESAKLAEQVRARIPSVTIRVTGVPVDDVSVSLDGAPVPTEALSAPRLVNPGTHTMAARPTHGNAVETTVELREGENRDVELKLVFVPAASNPDLGPGAVTPPPAGSEPPAQTMPAPSASKRLSPWVYVGFGVAAAGVGVGTVTGLLSISKATSVKDQCRDLACPSSVDGDLQSGRTLGTVSTIAFVGAGVGAVVGVLALTLWRHDDSPGVSTSSPVVVRPWLSATGAGFDGSF